MASIIEQRLVPRLGECFGPEVMRLQPDQSPFAIFPAKHPEVGEIAVYDDGDELTIVVGHFTHRHIGNYDEGLSDQQRADLIASDCIDFLKDIFADRMIFYGSHAKGGGCSPRTGEPRGFFSEALFGEKNFVWSGPL